MAVVAKEHNDEDMAARMARYTAAREAVADQVIYVPALKRYARASIQSSAVGLA
jgi:hypothetical protein